MAERQAPEGVIVELPNEQYRHYLRVLNRVDPGTAGSVASASLEHLRRLGKKRDMKLAALEGFEGDLVVDVGTLIAWMKKVQPNHKRAIKQLLAIDASAAARAGV